MHPHSEIAIDEDGRRIGTTDFDFAAVDHGEPGEVDAADEARLRQEVTRRLLQWLTAGNARRAEIGTRALVLQHLLNPESSQRKLAERLRLAESRVSERLSAMRRNLASGSF